MTLDRAPCNDYQGVRDVGVAVKRIEELDSPNGGGFCRARASLVVRAFGIQVMNPAPRFEESGPAVHSPAFTEVGATFYGP
jgi:hypothetical protein